jgi:hypothetical protein
VAASALPGRSRQVRKAVEVAVCACDQLVEDGAVPVAQSIGGRSARPCGAWESGLPWQPWETALLGTMPDAEVVARTGRTLTAVRSVRQKLRIPVFTNKGRRKGQAMR